MRVRKGGRAEENGQEPFDGTGRNGSQTDENSYGPEQPSDVPRRAPAGKRKYTRSSITLDEMQSRQDAKQRRRMIFYILLFVFITLAFLAVSFFVFFRIGEIRVTGNAMYTQEQIMEFISFREGDNLFSFDAAKAESALRKNLPYLGSVEISRKLPSTILVTVSERTEDLALHLGEEVYLISGDLQVLGRFAGNEVTPNITSLYTGSVARCLVGEELTFLDRRTDDNLKELYECLVENNIQKKVKSIDITSRFDITINYDDRFTVYLASTENIDIKVRFLVAILERLGSGESGYINLSDHREAAVRLDD